MKTAHTPTPWVLPLKKDRQRVNEPTEILDAEGHMIAFVPVWGLPDEPVEHEAQANAAFIVRAVNSHQALIDAAQDVLDNLREGDFISSTRLDALQNAIKLAKGE